MAPATVLRGEMRWRGALKRPQTVDDCEACRELMLQERKTERRLMVFIRTQAYVRNGTMGRCSAVQSPRL